MTTADSTSIVAAPSATRPVIRQGMFLLNELFWTIQGEGPSIGLPAVFVRLHLCNLHCVWCDTRYTWDPAHPQFNEYVQLSPADLATQIQQFLCRRLVVTGGEPLMHTAAIDELLALLPDWDVEIETNGTFAGSELIRSRCQLNISPKLPSSGNEPAQMYRPAVLRTLVGAANPYFKFVVTDEADFNAMETLITLCDIPHDRVIVMPEGRTTADITAHALAVVELVKARGYRLLPRLHVMLWGDKRGV